jgi:hypothetical protein
MLEELRQVHRAIAEVVWRTAKQQQIIAELFRGGRDTTQARALLATLRATRVEYERQRDTLVGQITRAELHSVRNLLPEAKYGSEQHRRATQR